jgi:ADP-heptose:LPS heptosyltransferase
MLHKEGFFESAGKVSDVTGIFSLSQFIEFIDSADVLVAGSTGPLHIASALGKVAIGLYPPIKPMHPGRWAPLGTNAAYIVKQTECEKCRKLNECECMKAITVDQVQQKIVAMVLSTNLKSKPHEGIR